MAKRMVARYVGAKLRSRLNLLVSQVKRKLRGKTVLVPTGAKLALYAARSQVRIEKAQRMLGYVPRYDLPRGMAATASYLRQTYRRAATSE
jgi:hypothetical protein